MPTASRFPGRPQLFAPFEQKNNAKIAITEITDLNAMSEKLLAANAAKQVPDLLDPGFTEMAVSWGKAGITVDLTDVIKALGGNEKFYPGWIRDLGCGGKMHGVPYMAPVLILWYRKDIFDQKSIKVPATWDDWLIAADKAAGTDPTTKKQVYSVSGYLSATHAHVMWQNMIGPNNGLTFDQGWKLVANKNPQTLNAMEFFLKLSKYFQPGAVNANYGDTGNLFASGTLAMTMTSTTEANAIIKAHADMIPKAATTPIPFGSDSDQKRGAFGDCYSWAVPTQSKHVDLSKTFIQWFMTPTTYIEAFKTIDYGHTPVLQSVINDPQFAKIVPAFGVDVVKTGLDAAKIATLPAEDYGPNPLSNLITTTGTWSNFLQRLYNKTDAPQAGLDQLADKINQLIQDNPTQLGC
ncbi:MAG: ABC transporter substrate-binding protein [Chloroflexota bacterium]